MFELAYFFVILPMPILDEIHYLLLRQSSLRHLLLLPSYCYYHKEILQASLSLRHELPPFPFQSLFLSRSLLIEAGWKTKEAQTLYTDATRTQLFR